MLFFRETYPCVELRAASEIWAAGLGAGADQGLLPCALFVARVSRAGLQMPFLKPEDANVLCCADMPYVRIWQARQASINARLNFRRVPGSFVALSCSEGGGERRGRDGDSRHSALCEELLRALGDCAFIAGQSASLVRAFGNERRAHAEQVTGDLRFGGWRDTDIFSASLCSELEKARGLLPADPEPRLQRVLASQTRCACACVA
jgi:hypothetical protein